MTCRVNTADLDRYRWPSSVISQLDRPRVLGRCLLVLAAVSTASCLAVLLPRLVRVAQRLSLIAREGFAIKKVSIAVSPRLLPPVQCQCYSALNQRACFDYDKL